MPEAFKDRQVLASCTLAKEGDGETGAQLRTQFYDFADIGLSDKRGRTASTRRAGGPRFRATRRSGEKAKLEYDTKKLRGITSNLGQDPQE